MEGFGEAVCLGGGGGPRRFARSAWGLRDQLLRASLSVSNNIAEGFRLINVIAHSSVEGTGCDCACARTTKSRGGESLSPPCSVSRTQETANARCKLAQRCPALS
ncbi:MAG: four helix bundle protein [Phycisphaerales bacterium]|nr:four helix bundle protein [Phycisphaerales bacterium]